MEAHYLQSTWNVPSANIKENFHVCDIFKKIIIWLNQNKILLELFRNVLQTYYCKKFKNLLV